MLIKPVEIIIINGAKPKPIIKKPNKIEKVEKVEEIGKGKAIDLRC